MPDDSPESLLVASPSNVRLEPRHGEATRPPGRPERGTLSASGSNSILGVCHCGREFPLAGKDEDLPAHHPGEFTMNRIRKTCDGSLRPARVFTGA